jgi:preprotein translocase subunit SecY
MISTLRNAWAISDLRRKILYTLMVIVIFRIGSALPVPFLDPTALGKMINSNSGNLLGYLDVLTGGAFSKATIFAMSVTPYINASIILQLLTVAIPALERMAKEGEEGRKKIATMTRYTTVILGLLQATAYYFTLRNTNAVKYTTGFAGIFVAVVIIAAFTAGTTLIMWLGEQINEKGIGNGISVILFCGILSRGPVMVGTLYTMFLNGINGTMPGNLVTIPLILVLAVAVVGFIVLMTNAERRIPVQYAQRVVGRKVYGGQNTHIPIKVNMSGVMPIIFASSFVSIPGTIKAFISIKSDSFWSKFFDAFNYTSWLYAVIYFLLIIAFNYFYVTIQYNPIEMANNLKRNSGTIPGIRPGRPTSDFISRILSKITLIGALFLGFVAILPIGLSGAMNVNIALGGTSLLIIVGVALETMRTLESQMMMRHYKGFLE